MLKSREALTLRVGQRPPTPAAAMPANAAPASIRRTTSRSIAVPQIRRRTDVPTSFKDEAGNIHDCPFGPSVRPFALPQCRILEPGYLEPSPASARTNVAVRYVLDHVDRMWLARYNGIGGAGGIAGDNRAGRPSGNAVAPSQGKYSAGGKTGTSTGVGVALMPTVMERIITSLEIAANASSRISFERIRENHITPECAEFCAEPAVRPHVESVRAHWVAKREANGGLPLIAEFVQCPPYDDQQRCCAAFVLADYRLPFSVRECSDHLLRRKALDPIPAALPCGAAAEDVEECRGAILSFLAAAKGVVEDSLARELLLLKDAQLTVFELACLRDHADNAALAGASSGGGDTGPAAVAPQPPPPPLSSASTTATLAAPFTGRPEGFHALDCLHPASDADAEETANAGDVASSSGTQSSVVVLSGRGSKR